MALVSSSVPAPALVRALAPETVPLTVKVLPLAMVQVWPAPRMMLAPIVLLALAVLVTPMADRVVKLVSAASAPALDAAEAPILFNVM